MTSHNNCLQGVLDNQSGLLRGSPQTQGIPVLTSLPNVGCADHWGSVMNNNHHPGAVGASDDDFFHLTCHIEPSLIHKIENGEFVELEKLLPKDRSSFTAGGGTENRLEWVQRDGGTYLVSAAGRENKITGIRHWEQAFRAYATIYCAANPQRSKEIWQYISVINTATSA